VPIADLFNAEEARDARPPHLETPFEVFDKGAFTMVK
jgi:hypothetical protein